VPGYSAVVERPISLADISKLVNHQQYRSFADFVADLHLLSDNALLFNKPASFFYNAAFRFRQLVDRLVDEQCLAFAGPANPKQYDAALSSSSLASSLAQRNQVEPSHRTMLGGSRSLSSSSSSSSSPSPLSPRWQRPQGKAKSTYLSYESRRPVDSMPHVASLEAAASASRHGADSESDADDFADFSDDEAKFIESTRKRERQQYAELEAKRQRTESPSKANKEDADLVNRMAVQIVRLRQRLAELEQENGQLSGQVERQSSEIELLKAELCQHVFGPTGTKKDAI
jgi:Bromodomain